MFTVKVTLKQLMGKQFLKYFETQTVHWVLEGVE